jgi:hypothetical protein
MGPCPVPRRQALVASDPIGKLSVYRVTSPSAARKSTEQTGVADDQKAVARQIDHARQYAERKGWTVDDQYIFVDDGISGAEFSNRPGFLRLMNALKPRASFQVRPARS